MESLILSLSLCYNPIITKLYIQNNRIFSAFFVSQLIMQSVFFCQHNKSLAALQRYDYDIIMI